MIVRCWLIYIYALFDVVSLEVTFRTSIGKSVVLPCSYKKDENQVKKVFWKHNDSMDVSEFSPVSNSPGLNVNIRAESFPDEYKNGNYSIKIKELEESDAGEYTCFIIPADHHENMQLIIDPKGVDGGKPATPSNIALIIGCLLLSICFFFMLFCFVRHKRLWIFRRT